MYTVCMIQVVSDVNVILRSCVGTSPLCLYTCSVGSGLSVSLIERKMCVDVTANLKSYTMYTAKLL